MPTRKKPELEKSYTYGEVGSFYDHDASVLHWVLTKGPRIKALRLREDFNANVFCPRAEVWVGDDSPTKEYGSTLANDTVQVPLFVKRNGGRKYTYFGDFEVLTDEATAAELATARKKVPHKRGVSRIVFLNKICLRAAAPSR